MGYVTVSLEQCLEKYNIDANILYQIIQAKVIHRPKICGTFVLTRIKEHILQRVVVFVQEYLRNMFSIIRNYVPKNDRELL